MDPMSSAASATADSPWPAVGYEDIPWLPSVGVNASRRARLRARGPYRAAVTPSIAEAHPELPAEVRAEAVEATMELARFDAEYGARLEPFGAILLRSESASSSQIENLTATAKRIGMAEAGDRFASPNARLIVANARAMLEALGDDGVLDGSALIRIHERLMADTEPNFVGDWRDEQVWIGGGTSPHTAAFVPPHHSRVPEAMADLERFMQRIDIAPLEQAAIAHAQFETIHPFPDGNGRTGRALVHAMLKRARVTRSVCAPISAGILHDTVGYFDALTAYREGDITPIVETFATAVYLGIEKARILGSRIVEAQGAWRERLRPRVGSALAASIELLISTPVISIDQLASKAGVSRAAADQAMARLLDAEVVTPASANKRNRLFVATEVTDALDDFAALNRRGR